MTALGTRRVCLVCLHLTYPAMNCGVNGCSANAEHATGPVPYEPHWHCDDDCNCTTVGCLTMEVNL